MANTKARKMQPSNSTEASAKTNSPHGSRRGAGSMIGATLGWFLGCIITLATKQIWWMIVMPLTGIILGAIIGIYVLPREALTTNRNGIFKSQL